MRIRELEDVLVLVDAMPRDKQMKCVRALVCYVDSWEGQQAEGVDDKEWARISDERSQENITRMVRAAVAALGAAIKKPPK